MTTFDKLGEMFRQFPGIGPRQAKRFVYFLLGKDTAFTEELGTLLEQLKREIAQCTSCYRFFSGRKSSLCALCADPNRDESELMVVARDTDLDAMERSGGFRGRYFVLGSTLTLLEKTAREKIRLKELIRAVEKQARESKLKEIILAQSANPDGEHTADELRKALSPLVAKHGLRVSTLGRGLSTGSELEYADSETIKSALKNRSL